MFPSTNIPNTLPSSAACYLIPIENLILVPGAQAQTTNLAFRKNGQSYLSDPSKNVVIDKKIDQALEFTKDFVKFAVNEEMVLLKAKIGQLKQKIERLTVENEVLNEHVLPVMQFQTFLPQHPGVAFVPTNILVTGSKDQIFLEVIPSMTKF